MIFPEHKMKDFDAHAASILINIIKNNPKAHILLPTGSTPKGMYTKFISEFSKTTLDCSQVTFFNLDEYVGLKPDHPLSYSYYMKVNVYDRLEQIDPKRSPKKTFIPSCPDPSQSEAVALNYRKKLANINIDLAILGIGGAYPVGKKLFGGHVAFNEPGSTPDDPTRVIQLTSKTKRDTQFRFTSLELYQENKPFKYSTVVPSFAITIGMREILKSNSILVLAHGEDKSPVIKYIFSNKPSSNFPCSYLNLHKNCTWILDSNSTTLLPHTTISNKTFRSYFSSKMPQLMFYYYSLIYKKRPTAKELIDFCIELGVVIESDSSSSSSSSTSSVQNTINFSLLSDSFETSGSPKSKPSFGSSFQSSISSSKAHSISSDSISTPSLLKFESNLQKCLNFDKLFNKNDPILFYSPHPDDDVISAGSAIQTLVENEYPVFIIYAVTGANGVRNEHLGADYEGTTESRHLKSKVRENEALGATQLLGVDPKNVFFLRGEFYYRRGIPGIDPITERDETALKEMLDFIKPRQIFFAAENDPHGAHGLSTNLLARVISKNLPASCSFFGYRGAYSEWDLWETDKMTILPFGPKKAIQKQEAIKSHKSQLKPLFPSFDSREFWERALQRNTSSWNLYRRLSDSNDHPYEYDSCEVFCKWGIEQFLERYLD